MPTPPDVRAISEPARGAPEEPHPTATKSQLAYGSLVFAAVGIPSTAVIHTSRITRPQQRDPGLQTPHDLRRVRTLATTGLHADDTPSLQLYEDGTFYCYGCGTGGSIYDFAGRLWSLETKGRAFLELRARLADCFGLRAGASS